MKSKIITTVIFLCGIHQANLASTKLPKRPTHKAPSPKPKKTNKQMLPSNTVLPASPSKPIALELEKPDPPIETPKERDEKTKWYKRLSVFKNKKKKKQRKKEPKEIAFTLALPETRPQKKPLSLVEHVKDLMSDHAMQEYFSTISDKYYRDYLETRSKVRMFEYAGKKQLENAGIEIPKETKKIILPQSIEQTTACYVEETMESEAIKQSINRINNPDAQEYLTARLKLDLYHTHANANDTNSDVVSSPRILLGRLFKRKG